MSRLLRALPWALVLLIVIAIAILAPQGRPGWLPRLALALMGFGGVFNLVWAVAGYITRRLSPVAALGAFIIGVGFLLYGSQWLPGRSTGGTLSIVGLALGILGMMLQVSAMQAARE